MSSLLLQHWHRKLGADWTELRGQLLPAHYGDFSREYHCATHCAGLFDLSYRGRICLTGADRQRFLHGQVTNDIQKLRPGEGCYGALINAKGKMVSDLNIYVLPQEILLDFEPGLNTTVSDRLNKYIIADDVQVVEVGLVFGLLSVQGPEAQQVIKSLQLDVEIPQRPFHFSTQSNSPFGDIYLMKQSRTGTDGFDLFVSAAQLENAADTLKLIVEQIGGRVCGWQTMETTRIEAGIPRFGADMDENNLAPETGIEERGISYTKGCYIGQEVVARIRTYGQVAKALRGLVLSGDSEPLPAPGDKLTRDGKEVGYITSAISSPRTGQRIALGYVRKEVNQIGTELMVDAAGKCYEAKIVSLPFQPLRA